MFVIQTKEPPMKNVMTTLMMLLCINLIIGQSDEPAIIIISASSTPAYIGEMKEGLTDHGLILNVEKEKWKNQYELEEFSFTLTDTKAKKTKSFEFKYNALNRHQVLLIYPTTEDSYSQILTDVSYLTSDILPLVISNQVKRMKPILHRSYGKSGIPYRQSIVLTDLKRIEVDMARTIAMYKAIKADQVIGRAISGLTYTYNGEYLQDPSGINLQDMTADVLIEQLDVENKIINIWSDEPLNQLISEGTMAGQR